MKHLKSPPVADQRLLREWPVLLEPRSLHMDPRECATVPTPVLDASDRIWGVFEAEVLPHGDRLFRLAMWFERDRSEAEELVQETMMQALRSFHRFQPGTNCGAWLTAILQHVRSNRRRARQRSPLINDIDDRISRAVHFVPPVPQELTDEEVLAALRRIPVRFQEVIVLSDVEELTYKEIAEALDIPLGTVMSRLHRGRALLRSELVATTLASSRRQVKHGSEVVEASGDERTG